MMSQLNLVQESVEKEDIDPVTKWLLIIAGLCGIFIALIGMIYQTIYQSADFYGGRLLAVILGITLIRKAQGKGKYFQIPWRTYFWFYTIWATAVYALALYGLIHLHLHETPFTESGMLSIVLFPAHVAALYGYAYKKEFLTKKLWKVLFVLAMGLYLWSYFVFAMDAKSFSLSGLGWKYMGYMLVVPAYYAFGMYAFKTGHMNQRNSLSVRANGQNLP